LNGPVAGAVLRIETGECAGKVKFDDGLKFAIGQSAGGEGEGVASAVVVVGEIPGRPKGDEGISRGCGGEGGSEAVGSEAEKAEQKNFRKPVHFKLAKGEIRGKRAGATRFSGRLSVHRCESEG
jgi:hypothetical protein